LREHRQAAHVATIARDAINAAAAADAARRRLFVGEARRFRASALSVRSSMPEVARRWDLVATMLAADAQATVRDR
jgi:hypothetical protein